ncbi:hypothetical protein BV22DRAFT_1041582 [Leucogyrophana mollusca]|uniref:Uncharacterized protein n=1 Tax=Leucogyrophana mollusca TaxID=85980 RepID=A0ACB8AYM3_9AGAM|nr:hypothetical protein BV22DRAFT_1041582 [Leucogyrophana mollusca]
MFTGIKRRNAEKKAKKLAEAKERKADIARRQLKTFGKVLDTTPGARGEGELWWVKHYQWLKDCGYLLRTRYAPDWVPSWVGTNKTSQQCEDGEVPWVSHLLDATRISDGAFVILKSLKKSRHPYEAEIGEFFMTEPLASDPANHCVPIYEVLSVPEDDDRIILVMPFLRPYNDPDFDTIGEVVDCVRQLFEGLQFMHLHHVAHRDCMNLNILMDATSLYIDPFHPFRLRRTRDLRSDARHFTRTQRPPKYYLIDFGISRRYRPSDSNPLELPILGGDKTVPEFRDPSEPRNPFPTDVYYIGNVLREDFIQQKVGFKFLEALVADMVQDDPSERPTMDEVVARFDIIRKGLSSWKLRSRVVDKQENAVSGLFRDAGHWIRHLISMAKGEPPFPTPSA